MPDIIGFIGAGVIPIFLVIIVVVLIVSYIGSRYKVAGANEALIVSGQRDKGPDGRKNLKVVRGGGVIVLPLIHKVGKLKLTARQINVQLADAVTRQGIKVAVQGVATFVESLRTVMAVLESCTPRQKRPSTCTSDHSSMSAPRLNVRS